MKAVHAAILPKNLRRVLNSMEFSFPWPVNPTSFVFSKPRVAIVLVPWLRTNPRCGKEYASGGVEHFGGIVISCRVACSSGSVPRPFRSRMRGFDGQFGILVIADRTPAGRQDLFDGFGSEQGRRTDGRKRPSGVDGLPLSRLRHRFSACLDNSDGRTGLLV